MKKLLVTGAIIVSLFLGGIVGAFIAIDKQLVEPVNPYFARVHVFGKTFEYAWED